MAVDKLLSRLQKVKLTGRGRWIACCPAHDDRTPSMTIRELDDGRILAHCFGGCDIHDVLSAVGLEIGDLFPEPLERASRIAAPFDALDALRCLARESGIIAIAVSDIANGKPLDENDAARVAKAAGRIISALEAVNARL